MVDKKATATHTECPYLFIYLPAHLLYLVYFKNLNIKKTDYLETVTIPGMLQINGQNLKKEDIFRYLGSPLQGNDDINGEVRARVNAAWMIGENSLVRYVTDECQPILNLRFTGQPSVLLHCMALNAGQQQRG